MKRSEIKNIMRAADRFMRSFGTLLPAFAYWSPGAMQARGGGMCYAEKVMISRENQASPMHRHVIKPEDIINRGRAVMC